MRYLLNTIRPDLERARDLTSAGPMLLLTRFATAVEIRAAKPKAIARFLRGRAVRQPDALAGAAYAAAQAHPNLKLPAEAATNAMIREMAQEAIACRTRLAALDRKLAELVQAHPDGTLIRSLPGMGVVLAAEFIAEAGDITRFRSAAALAAAGVAPVLRQSGKSRRLMRPAYANNHLKRVFHQAAFCSLADPLSRAFCQRKRRAGNAITRPSSPSRADVSTCSGPCSRPEKPSAPSTERQLDARTTLPPPRSRSPLLCASASSVPSWLLGDVVPLPRIHARAADLAQPVEAEGRAKHVQEPAMVPACRPRRWS